MPKIDIDNYIEQSGMRKARFGGYEPEDVHQAMEDLCADYEQHLTAMTSELRTLRQENDALRRHAQGLVMQNQTLSTQNATPAGRWISCKATAPISKRSLHREGAQPFADEPGRYAAPEKQRPDAGK